MTIIAFDGRYMVGDSLSTDNWHTRHEGAIKVRAIHNTKRDWHCVVGSAGKHHLGVKVFDFIRQADCQPADLDFSKVDPDHDQDVLLVVKDARKLRGLQLYRKTGPVLVAASYDFWALGIARDYAIAAMDLGMNAVDACKLAIKYNTQCGGNLTIVDAYQLKELT